MVRAQVSLVCCDEGRGIVYVGIEEKGRPALRFLPAPSGSVRLPADIVEAGAALEKAFMAAVERGDSAEDDSEGICVLPRSLRREAIQVAVRLLCGSPIRVACGRETP